MKLKKVVFSILIIIILVCTCFSLIRINIINTKMFSPEGNGRAQYEIIKEELGEDFEDFTKDDAGVKIYEEDSRINLVKIGDKEFEIKSQSEIIEGIKEIFDD